MAENLESAPCGASEWGMSEGYSRQNGGLFLVDRPYTPHRMPVHQHASMCLYFVLRGGVTERNRRAHYLLEPTTLCFLPRMEPHANEFHPETRLFEIFPEDAWLERIQAYCALPDAPRQFRSDTLTRLAARLHREFGEKDAAAHLAMEGLILEVFAEVCRQQDTDARAPVRRPDWLDQVIELLHARFTESPSLDEVAVTVGVHPAHLARMFRRHYGCSVGDYVRKLRIDQARRDLLSPDTPLVEIAVTAGYSDQSHFTAAFKRHTGMTPGEFRRSLNPRKSRDNTHR
jgi:AraC family transcriptional regulator